LQGGGLNPHTYTTTGTMTALNSCSYNLSPRIKGHGTGIISFIMWDNVYGGAGLDAYQAAATATGAHLTYYPDDQDHMTTEDKARIVTYIDAGNELGVMAASSTSLNQTYAMTVTYVGDDTNCSLVISGSGTVLTITTTEANDNYGPISLTTGNPYYIGSASEGLTKQINDLVKYNAAANEVVNAGTFDDFRSTGLVDGTYALVKNVATQLLVDRAAWNGRFFSTCIVDSKADIDAIIAGSTKGWPVSRSFFYPEYTYDATARTAIDNAGFSVAISGKDGAASSIADILSVLNSYYLSGLYTAAQGASYAGLTDAQKEARIRGFADTLSDILQSGNNAQWINIKLTESMATHLPELSQTETTWLFDELTKRGILLLSVSEAYDWLVANGTWVGDAVTTPTTLAPDLHLLPSSPCINAGTPIVGLTTDYDGLLIRGLPDIGAFEYQPKNRGRPGYTGEGGDAIPYHLRNY